MKILVSGVGGAAFPYLYDLMKDEYDFVFIDSDANLKNVYTDMNIIIVPLVISENYVSTIKNIVLREKIDVYIPLIDEEIEKALIIGNEIKDLIVLSPNWEFVKLCLDKYSLMKELSRLKISHIESYLSSNYCNQINYPIFVKPNIGRGSRGIKVINNDEDYNGYLSSVSNVNDILIQEVVEGDEYTVSVVVNNLNEIIAIVPKKVIVKKGITKHAVTEYNSIIESVCLDIVEKLKPNGSINVQLFLVNDTVRIFEINPRFSTTITLTCEAGINEIDLAIKNHDKKEVKYIKEFRTGLNLYRTWLNNFYV